ncbi:winged helix-turn-helix domain-containing protein [Halorussus salinus]|uniref:winged helix-turn-helix domain-containing protein n=1 Tax=Halorussus salinus TaxID=1364935 RepID=UPI0010919F9C|nr:winged helix-turn-helix domain-containing protein [Halorussus salinus]
MTGDAGPLTKIYGHPARLKIVETALANPNRAFNVRELATASDLDESTVHQHKDLLVELGLLDRVSLGRIDGYQLADSELARVGQEWRDLHHDRLDALENDTETAIEDFYGVAEP